MLVVESYCTVMSGPLIMSMRLSAPNHVNATSLLVCYLLSLMLNMCQVQINEVCYPDIYNYSYRCFRHINVVIFSLISEICLYANGDRCVSEPYICYSWGLHASPWRPKTSATRADWSPRGRCQI